MQPKEWALVFFKYTYKIHFFLKNGKAPSQMNISLPAVAVLFVESNETKLYAHKLIPEEEVWNLKAEAEI